MGIAITVCSLTRTGSETFRHQMIISVRSIDYTLCRRNRFIIITDTNGHFSQHVVSCRFYDTTVFRCCQR